MDKAEVIHRLPETGKYYFLAIQDVLANACWWVRTGWRGRWFRIKKRAIYYQPSFETWLTGFYF